MKNDIIEIREIYSVLQDKSICNTFFTMEPEDREESLMEKQVIFRYLTQNVDKVLYNKWPMYI